jgi:hypothetical protein
LKSSLSELSSKLVASHTQHCEAAAQSEATIRGLNEKYGKASGELAVLRSAVEAAALDQERAEEQMNRLQHDLDSRAKDLHAVCTCCLPLAEPAIMNMLESVPSACESGLFCNARVSCIQHSSHYSSLAHVGDTRRSHPGSSALARKCA